MSFGSPLWLWGLLALPLLGLVFVLLERRQRRKLLSLARPAAAFRIARVRGSRLWPLRAALLLLATLMVLLALARPRWGVIEEERHTRGLDLVLAIDLSRSMAAQDVSPSRLDAARQAARDLARALPADRIGLAGFAGNSGMLCPLTLDRGALELYLATLDPGLMEAQGTDLGAAIDTAREMLIRHSGTSRAVVILSDGEDHEGEARAALDRAREAGIVIFAVGVGTGNGAPVPDRDDAGKVTGYRTGRDGRVVTTRLREESLIELTRATSGTYARLTRMGQPLPEVLESLKQLRRGELGQKLLPRQHERYRWPLAAAFLAAALEAAVVLRRREGMP